MSLSDQQRETVHKRANGCCEYCRVSEEDDVASFHVDHIRPRKHRGSDELENLCLSCTECNAHKGWDVHFRLEENAIISGLTAAGRTTVDILNINETKRVKRRHFLIELGAYPCRPRNK